MQDFDMLLHHSLVFDAILRMQREGLYWWTGLVYFGFQDRAFGIPESSRTFVCLIRGISSLVVVASYSVSSSTKKKPAELETWWIKTLANMIGFDMVMDARLVARNDILVTVS